MMDSITSRVTARIPSGALATPRGCSNRPHLMCASTLSKCTSGKSSPSQNEFIPYTFTGNARSDTFDWRACKDAILSHYLREASYAIVPEC